MKKFFLLFILFFKTFLNSRENINFYINIYLKSEDKSEELENSILQTRAFIENNSLIKINSNEKIPLSANNGYVLNSSDNPFSPLSTNFVLSKYNLSNIVTYTGTTSSVLYLGFPSKKPNSDYFSVNGGTFFPYTKDFGLIIMNPKTDTKQILAFILTQENNLGWQILSPSFLNDGTPSTDIRKPLLISDYSDSLFFGHEVGPFEIDAKSAKSIGNTVFGNDSGVTYPNDNAFFGNTVFGKFNFSNASSILSLQLQTPSSSVQSVANTLNFTSRENANNRFFSSGWCNTIIGTNNVVIKPIGSKEIYEEFLVPLKSKNYNVVVGFGNMGNDSFSTVNSLQYISQNIILGNVSFRNVNQSGRNILIGNQNCSSYDPSMNTSFNEFYENIIIGNSIFWGSYGNTFEFYWEKLNRNIILLPDGLYYEDEANFINPILEYSKADSLSDQTTNGIFLGTCGNITETVDRSFETYINNVYEGIIPKNDLYTTACPHSVWVSNENLFGSPIPISSNDYLEEFVFTDYIDEEKAQMEAWYDAMLQLPIFGVKLTDYQEYDKEKSPKNSALFGIDVKRYIDCQAEAFSSCPSPVDKDRNFLYYIPKVPLYSITKSLDDKFSKITESGPFEFIYLIPLIIYGLKQLNQVNLESKKNIEDLNKKYTESINEIQNLKIMIYNLKLEIEKLQNN